MSKQTIDEILDKMLGDSTYHDAVWYKDAKVALSALIDEVIGDDEVTYANYDEFNRTRTKRDELRAEQRKRAKELLG